MTNKFKHKLRQKGTFGIRSLIKNLNALDCQNSGRLSVCDFKTGLINNGLLVSDEVKLKYFYQFFKGYQIVNEKFW